MNYIKVGNRWINLNQVAKAYDTTNADDTPFAAVDFTDGSRFGFYNEEHRALIAWLSVPEHMAGAIADEDRDVMVWWQWKQETADATETEA